MTHKALLITSTLAATLALSGCLIPERFTAKVDVQPDASYSFRYSGTVIHGLAAMQIKKQGALSEKELRGLEAETQKLSKSPDVKKAEYKGDARYVLETEGARKPGQPLRMFDFFSVSTDKSGVMTIAARELKDKDKRELEQLGIKVDGSLEVSIPKNAEVLSQNASSTPTLGFGSYSWKIGRLDQRPEMKIRFKP